MKLTRKQLYTLAQLLDAPIEYSDSLINSDVHDTETSRAYIEQVQEGTHLKALQHQLLVEWDETPVESGSPEPMCLKEFGGYGSCVLREDHTTERCRDAVGNRFMGRKPVTIAEWRAKRGPVDGRYSSHGGVSFT